MEPIPDKGGKLGVGLDNFPHKNLLVKKASIETSDGGGELEVKVLQFDLSCSAIGRRRKRRIYTAR